MGPPYPGEDLSLSTRINQGSGGGQPTDGDGGPVPLRYVRKEIINMSIVTRRPISDVNLYTIS